MKLKRFFRILSCFAPATIAFAQSPFQNLDFELAQVAPQSFPERVPITNALPYWQGTAAGAPATEAGYNGIMLDYPQIGLYDQESILLPSPVFRNYSAFLMADIGSWESDKAELFQSGLIPAGSRSIRFATTAEPLLQAIGLKREDWSLSLLVDGMAVFYSPLETSTNHVLWGADISAKAGKVAEIRFSLHTCLRQGLDDAGIALGLDGIEFSVLPLPPALKNPKFVNDGSFQFLLIGQTGETYTVQFSTNLTNWITLTNVSGATEPLTIQDQGASNAPVRFYRTTSP